MPDINDRHQINARKKRLILHTEAKCSDNLAADIINQPSNCIRKRYKVQISADITFSAHNGTLDRLLKYYTPKTTVLQANLDIFTIFVNYANIYVNTIM